MMSFCTISNYVPIIILLLQLNLSSCTCKFMITFDNPSCKFNQSYFKNFSSSIQNSALNMDFNLLRPLTQGYGAHVDMQLRLAQGSKYQSILYYDFNVCNVLHNIKKLTLMKTWYKKVLLHGNFMENCPVEVGHYYLRNLSLDHYNIPVFWQKGDYRIEGRSFFGKYKSAREIFVCECSVDAYIK